MTLKLYRDLAEGETLQAGDETLSRPVLSWRPVDPVFFDANPGKRFRPEYRRPVDAVPREKYEKLQRELERTKNVRNKYLEASRAYCDDARRLHQNLAQAERLLCEATEGAEPMNAELANLRHQLAQERVEHGRTAHERDTLRAELDAAQDLIRQMEIM